MQIAHSDHLSGEAWLGKQGLQAYHCLWPSDTLAFLNQSGGMYRVLGLYAGWSGLLFLASLISPGARKGNLSVRLAKRAASEQSSMAPA